MATVNLPRSYPRVVPCAERTQNLAKGVCTACLSKRLARELCPRGNSAVYPGCHTDAVVSAGGAAYVTVFPWNDPDLLASFLTTWAANSGHGHGIAALWVAVWFHSWSCVRPPDGLGHFLERRMIEHGQGCTVELFDGRGEVSVFQFLVGELNPLGSFLYIVRTWGRGGHASKSFTVVPGDLQFSLDRSIGVIKCIQRTVDVQDPSRASPFRKPPVIKHVNSAAGFVRIVRIFPSMTCIP
ncbi:hypothetical protein BJX99DRAFT_217281 [Aspergillus californicus]